MNQETGPVVCCPGLRGLTWALTFWTYQEPGIFVRNREGFGGATVYCTRFFDGTVFLSGYNLTPEAIGFSLTYEEANELTLIAEWIESAVGLESFQYAEIAADQGEVDL